MTPWMRGGVTPWIIPLARAVDRTDGAISRDARLIGRALGGGGRRRRRRETRQQRRELSECVLWPRRPLPTVTDRCRPLPAVPAPWRTGARIERVRVLRRSHRPFSTVTDLCGPK